MNPVIAASVVKIITEAWPYAEATDNAVELWSDACPEIEQATAADAMRRLVRSEERPPSIARFLAECRLINRERSTPYMAIGPAAHTTKAESKARIAALRVFWREASAGRPDHNHHNGDDVCPACSTADEWVAEHAPQILAVLRES